ncbi:putative inorganic phosphate cotransporter [Diabrotica virgifera virgifera]|uniref:Major facilitator superfamily (MFS) profile domain-containing protein n=2 Tax=Diabrotica virgifera virgifera TaxID=50390 RepID=A0ABM5IP26_DIAVI|nr:putative inorganic phosphate cotransporter [Diabrotica virgifera virgifera]
MKTVIKTYDWKNKGIILSAYMWGLAIPQLFAGWLSSRYNIKRILISMMITASIIGFLIPVAAANFGSTGVIICRLIQGMALGTTGPCQFSLYGKWIPPNERCTLMGVVFSGDLLGIIVSMFLSGVLAASRFGWPLVIYIYSTIGLLWSVLFAFVASNSPAEHSTITKEERYYIQWSLSQNHKRKYITPWRKILTSACVWSSIVSKAGSFFGFILILTQISNYMKNVLKFDIKENGIYSALPYICTFVAVSLFGYISDKITSRNILSVTTTRKLFVTIGTIFPCLTLLLITLSKPEEKVKIIIAFALTVSLDMAGNIQGTGINSVDLSPNHAGFIEGLSNQVSQILSSLSPLLVDLFVSNEENNAQWNIVLYISLGIRIVSATIFLIFGSGQVQPWNEEILADD